ncbi:MAG: histidine phosphatase family protein [Rubrivivax sp.]|nr:histidine phosphatase family protein [Rubrivivax sp.]
MPGPHPVPGPTRVFVLRHGETAWNVERRIQGQLDVPLNERGRWQAVRLAQALAGEKLAAVYSSDLQRARDTAAAVAAAAGVALHIDPGLRERAFGVFEGQTFEEIERRWPEELARWRRRDPGFEAQGGERLDAFYARSVGVAGQHAARHPAQAIALVAHGGVLDCLYRAAAGIELGAARTWQVANAAVNRLRWTPEGFAIVRWNDTAHLGAESPEAGLADEPR